MTEILQWIIAHADRTYRKGNWAGKGVLPGVEGISVEAAHWRPHPDQHTIAEIVLHMAYWKDAAATQLAGRPWTYDDASDWRAVPTTAQGWAAARAELQAAHERLMTDLRAVPADRLLEPVARVGADGDTDRAIDLAVDIATHDHYHAAQIFVLKRLSTGAAAPPHA